MNTCQKGNTAAGRLHRRILPVFFAVLAVLFFHASIAVCQPMPSPGITSYIAIEKKEGSFSLCASSIVAPLLVGSQDYPGVKRVAHQLADDLHRVTNFRPEVVIDIFPAAKEVIIAGTVGKNIWIDSLVHANKLSVEGLAGRWEAFVLQVVEKPFPGIEKALVIAGSDKRGTIYGMYDLSSQIGVSPWYWWADVPVKKQESLYVLPGRHTQGEPAIKYRGLFINDEAPALSGWVYEKFGGFNSKFYAHVFELILRLKGNYLWPAMWGRAFADDDSLNPGLADEYGVVVGTSHHEPMMRAHDEWRRYGKGEWNYEKNDSVLREFWKQGIRRMGSNESIITLGMRGDGDMPMTEGANIAVLERIVRDQRRILGETSGKDITQIPQLWALYKEVQEYYDKGMRVPDDITLLLCDDNWGNIRKLPKLIDTPRAGGYGIYYHFDYVGGPRNYKWVNTNQISRVWEQMHLAYSYGVDKIWIVNVGDIKPMEFPLSFFMDYAWNPDRWPANRLPDYTQQWAAQQFGEQRAKEIADLLTSYTTFNSRRKPELIAPDTYSQIHYREAERVAADYNALAAKAQLLSESLLPDAKDAFYQLVLHPVTACANLNQLYYTVGKNHLYASQGRAATNALATQAKVLFERDSAISYHYNRMLADGKWNHMMDQTHIGYTYWQQPDFNAMPAVNVIANAPGADMGVAIEGSALWWPKDSSVAVLPEFDSFNQQTHYIDIFNRGTTPFHYSIQSGKSWLHVGTPKGDVSAETRVWIAVDWKNVPAGKQRVPITITGPKKTRIDVYAVIHNPPVPKKNTITGFVESDGVVSMEAEHFTAAVTTDAIQWQIIPNIGRTLSGVTPVPVTASSHVPGKNSPALSYSVYLFSTDTVAVNVFVSPTLNFQNNQGLRYAISFDDELPRIITINNDNMLQTWERWVAANVNITTSRHAVAKPGQHLLKFWMVDPGIVLQKIVVETKEAKPCYLGPPESFRSSAVVRQQGR